MGSQGRNQDFEKGCLIVVFVGWGILGGGFGGSSPRKSNTEILNSTKFQGVIMTHGTISRDQKLNSFIILNLYLHFQSVRVRKSQYNINSFTK